NRPLDEKGALLARSDVTQSRRRDGERLLQQILHFLRPGAEIADDSTGRVQVTLTQRRQPLMFLAAAFRRAVGKGRDVGSIGEVRHGSLPGLVYGWIEVL